MFQLSADNMSVLMMILGNVVSVVGVVIFNKILYTPPFDFKFGSALVAFHFMCTWGFTIVALRLGWFKEKRIPTEYYVKLGFAQMLSVGFVNLSLLYNSVGMYQVMKFSNILVTCLFEFMWHSRSYTPKAYCSLLGIVAGVTYATLTQVEFRLIGFVHGCLGSVCTSVYQIYNKKIQEEHDVRSLQLLHYEQRWSALFAALFALVTDDVVALVNYPFSFTIVPYILLSGVCAFGVNVTCYLIIGKTSPVTYGVVGHAKTCLILAFGFIMWQEEVSARNFLGIMIAFVSIVWYTHLSSIGKVVAMSGKIFENKPSSPKASATIEPCGGSAVSTPTAGEPADGGKTINRSDSAV